MQEIYHRLMTESRRIASRYKVPEFYARFRPTRAISRRTFFQHPILKHCRELVRPFLLDNFGHGLQHATKVSLDAGTILLLEGEKYFTVQQELERALVLVQLAGLLHDIRRGQESHAEAGAQAARDLLRDFPLKPSEVNCVAEAIINHEAFADRQVCESLAGQLLGDALYDADKFRWGPDNFTHTVWYMADYRDIEVVDLVEKFPWGVSGILRIRDSFRTNIGRQYGPEIIDLGVRIGREIYQYLQKYVEELKD
ncbi:MAG: HD domain-containing protein [Deltaproteobacteria bacterium]|nr:HD domain-containing protein [Deltaproteobacteria bacterium]MBW2071322.1 HD domain-containing protein [Deltaproteobacteria bacterium]